TASRRRERRVKSTLFNRLLKRHLCFARVYPELTEGLSTQGKSFTIANPAPFALSLSKGERGVFSSLLSPCPRPAPCLHCGIFPFSTYALTVCVFSVKTSWRAPRSSFSICHKALRTP